MSFCLRSIPHFVNVSSYSLLHRYKSTIPEKAPQYSPILIGPINESDTERVGNKSNNSIKAAYPEDKMESKNGPRFLMLLTKTSFPKAVSYIYEKQEKDLNTPEMWDQAQLTGVIQKIEKTLDDH
ncbi:MAG: hypothetical protein VXX85_01330 [Candidatus Margulisiibacteriota bacterium]|nr:hypothetical protein [Candidatus Margulisiibacteriota bacterium]